MSPEEPVNGSPAAQWLRTVQVVALAVAEKGLNNSISLGDCNGGMVVPSTHVPPLARHDGW